MTSFEIFLIVMACSVPFVALMFVLPKFKKKEKQPVPTKTYEELKKEESSMVVEQEQPKEEKESSPFKKQDIIDDDFKGYLQQRQKSMSRPKRNELPANFLDTTQPYLPMRGRSRRRDEPKTVAEEIRSLSPELKALIIAGVLDKKDFE